jgi:predicted PurR-regulated permease PerM
MYDQTARDARGCGWVTYQENDVNSRPQADIARIRLIIAVLSLPIFGTFYIIRPFLPALIWATMIVVATWVVAIGIKKWVVERRWLHEVPLAGERSAREWQRLSDAGRGSIVAQAQPYAIVAEKWLLSQSGALGVLAIHLALTVVIARILHTQSEAAANRIMRFATRIAAERGVAAVCLTALSNTYRCTGVA